MRQFWDTRYEDVEGKLLISINFGVTEVGISLKICSV
jgi:hypothetical protein